MSLCYEGIGMRKGKEKEAKGGEVMWLEHTKLKCPKCKSRSFTAIEVCECTTQFVIRDGVCDRDDGINEPGDMVRLDVTCDKCGYTWRPRHIRTKKAAVQITDIMLEWDERKYNSLFRNHA